MKFTATGLKSRVFLLLCIALFCAARLRAQDSLPAVDVAGILLSETVNNRSLCIEDGRHQVKHDQLPLLRFTPAPKNIFRHLTTRQTEEDWWVCFRLRN